MSVEGDDGAAQSRIWADDGSGRFCLDPSALGERLPIHRLVAGLPVGQAHQPYNMAQRTPLGRCPTGLDIGIIRVGTDNEHSRWLF